MSWLALITPIVIELFNRKPAMVLDVHGIAVHPVGGGTYALSWAEVAHVDITSGFLGAGKLIVYTEMADTFVQSEPWYIRMSHRIIDRSHGRGKLVLNVDMMEYRAAPSTKVLHNEILELKDAVYLPDDSN